MRMSPILAVVAVVSLLFCCNVNAQECTGTQCRTPVRNTVKAATHVVAETVHVVAHVATHPVKSTAVVVQHTLALPVVAAQRVHNRRVAPVRNFLHRVRCR